MTQTTKNQPTTTRSRPTRVRTDTPRRIGNWLAGRVSMASCTFALGDDRRVEIRSPALASRGNR